MDMLDKLEWCWNVYSSTYGVDFFRKFDLVMNALDNRGMLVNSLISHAQHCLQRGHFT